jgi:hypothetical protein
MPWPFLPGRPVRCAFLAGKLYELVHFQTRWAVRAGCAVTAPVFSHLESSLYYLSLSLLLKKNKHVPYSTSLHSVDFFRRATLHRFSIALPRNLVGQKKNHQPPSISLARCSIRPRPTECRTGDPPLPQQPYTACHSRISVPPECCPRIPVSTQDLELAEIPGHPRKTWSSPRSPATHARLGAR